MQRVIALHARTCERLAVLLDFYLPFRIPVPDVYKHLIVGVLRIGISIFLELRFQCCRHFRRIFLDSEPDIVQVIGTELLVRITPRALVAPFLVRTADVPDGISARCAVGADMDARCEISRPPP